jgi:hypothetical protein
MRMRSMADTILTRLAKYYARANRAFRELGYQLQRLNVRGARDYDNHLNLTAKSPVDTTLLP